MPVVSFIWTIALLPLLAASVFLLLMAIDARNWLTCAALGTALAAGTWRVFLATQVPALGRDLDHAEAAMTPVVEVEVGVRVWFMLDWIFGATFVIAWSLGMLADGGAREWWVVLAAGVAALVLGGRLWIASRGPLLKITRDGIWEPVFGWVSWHDVRHVELLSSLPELSTTLRDRSYHGLCVEIDPERHAAFVQRPQRKWRGMRTAQRLPRFHGHDTRAAMIYFLKGRAIHPEAAAAAALHWWAVARGLPPPSTQPVRSRVQRSAGQLAGMERKMRNWTGVVLACWLLTPLAWVVESSKTL